VIYLVCFGLAALPGSNSNSINVQNSGNTTPAYNAITRSSLQLMTVMQQNSTVLHVCVAGDNASALKPTAAQLPLLASRGGSSVCTVSAAPLTAMSLGRP
jgi:hypothetical protein